MERRRGKEQRPRGRQEEARSKGSLALKAVEVVRQRDWIMPY